MQGYAGKIMEINLTTSTTTAYLLDEDLARECIGGIGFNARILYDSTPVGIDAMSPENVLVFGVGALVGSPFPTASITEASAKSPLTGGFGSSHSGGFFGTRLKNAGYDALVIKGRAPNPAYIHIDNQKTRILDAAGIWGQDAREAIDIIKSRHDGTEIALIGTAGEKLVRLAGIENGYDDGWRGSGLGAVMGSKNLKAIAVKGSIDLVPDNVQALLNATRKGQEAIKKASSSQPLCADGSMNATIPYGNLFEKLDMPEDLKAAAIDLDHNTVDIARMAVWAENLVNLFNAAGICIKPPLIEAIGPTILAEAINAFTGIDIIPQGLIWSAERTWNLIKLFNLREGKKGGDSKFLRCFYQEAIAGKQLDEEKVPGMLEEYYEVRGWNQDGYPYAETKQRLNLDYMLQSL